MLHRMAKHRAVARGGIDWLSEGLEHRVVIARSSQSSRKERHGLPVRAVIALSQSRYIRLACYAFPPPPRTTFTGPFSAAYRLGAFWPSPPTATTKRRRRRLFLRDLQCRLPHCKSCTCPRFGSHKKTGGKGHIRPLPPVIPLTPSVHPITSIGWKLHYGIEQCKISIVYIGPNTI